MATMKSGAATRVTTRRAIETIRRVWRWPGDAGPATAGAVVSADAGSATGAGVARAASASPSDGGGGTEEGGGSGELMSATSPQRTTGSAEGGAEATHPWPRPPAHRGPD